MDTYKSQAAFFADKDQLITMLGALDAARSQLRLDACRTWAIRGKRGYLATWGDGSRWFIYCSPDSARKWNNVRRSLEHLGRCTQDGDDEGIIRIDRLPTPEEATLIRKAVGLVRRRPAPTHGFLPSPTKSTVQDDSTSEDEGAGRVGTPEPVA